MPQPTIILMISNKVELVEIMHCLPSGLMSEMISIVYSVLMPTLCDFAWVCVPTEHHTHHTNGNNDHPLM